VKLFRKAEDRSLTRSSLPKSMMVGTIAGEPVSVRGALALSDAFACVRVLANAGSQCPAHVYRRTGDARRRVETAASDLLREPAPGVPGATFVAQIVAHLSLWGEAFVAKFREGETIVQLGLLAPDAVQVEILNGERVFDWTDLNGQRHRLTREDVVHCFGVSVDGIRGLSPVGSAREGLGLNSALGRYAGATFRNGARLGGVLKVPPGPESEDLIANLTKGFEARHAGTDNAGKVAVVSGDIGFEQVTMSMSDAEFIAARELSTREVCRIFSVPPSLIAGESGGSMTYSTVALEMQALQRLGLGPLLNYVAAALSADRDLVGPMEYIDFSYEGLLRADDAARAQFYSAGIGAGWLTPNDVRRLEDLPPLEGGDAPRQPSNPPPQETPSETP